MRLSQKFKAASFFYMNGHVILCFVKIGFKDDFFNKFLLTLPVLGFKRVSRRGEVAVMPFLPSISLLLRGGHGQGGNQQPGGSAPMGGAIVLLISMAALYGSKKVYEARKNFILE